MAVFCANMKFAAFFIQNVPGILECDNYKKKFWKSVNISIYFSYLQVFSHGTIAGLQVGVFCIPCHASVDLIILFLTA